MKLFIKKLISWIVGTITLVSGTVIFAQAVTTTVTVPTPSSKQPTQTTVISTTTSNPNTPTEADGLIVSGIYAKFSKDAAMTGTNLTATSLHGIVTLSGTVTQQSQADEAMLVAKKVTGVKSVISNITVVTNPGENVQPNVNNY